jgi:tRNA nucleotidyltransferase (CCA-adding enzyme)
MDVPPAGALLASLRSLPAAAPLLERIGDEPGVHLVGGAVRDLLRGEAPAELDLVVEGDAAELASRLGGSARRHDRFGTSTVSLNGFTYDIARARRETYAHPGALPEVTPASLDEDLLRRDFTVNAAAIALSGPRAGELRTAPWTLDDLEARWLRVLHDRSFVDDPTRLLRLARYASRLSFAVEPHTRALAAQATQAGALSTVSGSRIGAELRLLAREAEPIAALQALSEHGLAAAIDPDLGLVDPALAARALALLPEDGRQDLLALALATRRVPQRRLAALLDALAFEAADRDVILATATRAEPLATALERATRASDVAQAAAGAPPELIALAGALGPAERASEWLTRLRRTALEIDGGDLIAAGVPEGPAIGAGLRAALAAKLDGRASGREQELEEALRAAR